MCREVVVKIFTFLISSYSRIGTSTFVQGGLHFSLAGRDIGIQ
jgi:hypothetical protein